ncbi:MAG: hypothetical protein DRP66_11365, partial [Planctomycetota bacterium]
MVKRKKRVEKSRAANGMAAWCLALAALGAMALAQVEPSVGTSGAPQQAPEVAESTQPGVSAAEDELAAQAIQSLSFKEGTTISAALRFLQVKYKKNIIPISRMDDQITVTELFNVTFKEALQAILGTNKFEVQENGSITVYTPEEYEQMKDDKRRMETRVFTLYYISAEEAKNLITPVVSEAGSIEATQAP